MMNRLMKVLAVLLLCVTAGVAQARNQRVASVGMRAYVEQVVLPGSELIAAPSTTKTVVIVRIVKTYNETGQVLNCVNREKAAVAKQVLVIRHFNKPGVLAHVLGHLNEVNINVLEMNNVVLTGGVSCCAYISINDAPPPGLISKIEEHDLVVSAKTFVMS